MALDNPNELQIIGAAYGLGRVTGQVIALVNRTTTPQSLSVEASNVAFGDTWPHNAKSLTVVYRYGDSGNAYVATAKENDWLNITGPGDLPAAPDADASSPLLTVWGASYGPENVTDIVRGKIAAADQSLALSVNNVTFRKDSWPDTTKSFVIVASYANQVPFVDIAVENSSYYLKYRPPLQIISAFYGLLDVTAKLQSSVSRRTLAVAASDSVFGDGWPGNPKSLAVVYQYGDQAPQLAIAKQNAILAIDYDARIPAYSPPVDADKLNVIAAAYGLVDVTATVTGSIANQRLDFVAGNEKFGDGWPGAKKSFTMVYSWGPSDLITLVAQENQRVTVTGARSGLTQALVTLEGLMADGDALTIQTGAGLYWSVGPAGQILATAADLDSAEHFTIRQVTVGQPGIALQSSDGTYVILGSNGTLNTGGTDEQAARLAPSLLSSGGITLSLADGTGAPFIAVNEDGALIPSSSYSADFASQFNLRLTATAAGTANHLRACTGRSAAELDAEDKDELLEQVVQDLTCGFFLAIGLGPLIFEGVPKPGLLALVRSNKRASAALDALIVAVRNNPEKSVIAALLSFEALCWDERLMWRIFRLLANQAPWWMVAYVATTVMVKIGITPELEAAQLSVSFAIWAYRTHSDILAYVNSGGAAAMAAIGAAGPETIHRRPAPDRAG